MVFSSIVFSQLLAVSNEMPYVRPTNGSSIEFVISKKLVKI